MPSDSHAGIKSNIVNEKKGEMEPLKQFAGDQAGGGSEMDAVRRAVCRYAELNERLPYHTKATCPKCQKRVIAAFHRDKASGGIILRYYCDDCRQFDEVHHDAIWSEVESDRDYSVKETFTGAAIKPNARTLPRTVETLCPECSAVIIGRYFIEADMVMIEKTCPEHGYFRDIINRNVKLFLKSAQWSFQELGGLENPNCSSKTGVCPADCGLCDKHQSCSCLANIDLTNRCNLDCPVCFANANVQGYIYEPDYDEIVQMLQNLRDIRPTPATAVQFSGGEPTIHPDFIKIVAKAAEMGFSNIQIATNGLKMANYEFARQVRDAGMHTLYLQFDGIGPEVYKITRGRDVWDKKLEVIENCRNLDMKICLVPTIINTVNDDQVGEIFKFAVKNIDVISGISYQPVCFTGRIDPLKRLQQRYTLGDLARDIAQVSGADVERDFYPLSIVMPISQLLETVTGDPKIKSSCHTDCALGTYFMVDSNGEVYPFPQVVDVEKMFAQMNRFAHKHSKRAGRLNFIDKWRLYRMFKGFFKPDQMPPGMTVKRFMATLQGMVDKNKGRGKSGQSNYRTLMAAGMHFQDRYNYDVERVKRCVIPYSTPAGIVPFCAYNSGPEYRTAIEKDYAR